MGKSMISCFMYSQEQIREEKEVNKKVGRDFLCGTVSVGPKQVEITDIIDLDALKAYSQRYPDATIIYKGQRSKTNYTAPKTPYIGTGRE